METAVENARSFTELLNVGDEGPYSFSRMFSSEGWSARRRSKRAFKLLKKIDEPLRAMLREGESVSFLTSGVVQPSFLEWYFLGWALYYMQRRAVVVTNQRILLIQIDSRGRPKEARNQISYNAIAEFRKTGLGNIKFKFRNGGTAQLAGVPGPDRKWLAKVFDQGFQAFEAAAAQSAVENLCPHCYAPVQASLEACPACGGAFKSRKMAARLSLVFPGAGDVYLGHKAFGAMEVLMASFFWLAVVALAFDPTFGFGELLIGIAVMVVFMHGADAFATGHIARKGVLPASGRTERWRFGVAAILPVLGISTVLLAAPGKAKLRPQAVAVAGDQLPAEHLDALRSAGHVGETEVVRYFYSNGPSTVLQDGNLFTDDRIVSYVTDMDSTWISSARLDDVVDLDVQLSGPDAALSSIYVVQTDASAFYLIVASEGGGDVDFADALVELWREVRSAGNGVWFDGGSGESVEDAVVLRGLTASDRSDIAGLEKWWLRAWFGTEGVDWTIASRSVAADGPDEQSVVTVQHTAGGRQQVYFRTSS